jgi:hypothetical protein
MEDKLSAIFSDALTLSPNAIAYSVSKQLADLYPQKFMLQGADYNFKLDQFIDAEHCHAELNTAIFNQIDTEFVKSEGLNHEVVHAWYHVTWQGQRLEVILTTFHDSECRQTHYRILADTQQVAERFFWEVCEWASEVRGEVLVFEEGYWNKSKSLFQAISNSNFDNLILPPRLKREIQDDFAQFFASRAIYEQHGVPWKRGVLLIGPPGNGKSHTVKALINSLNVPCLYVKSFLSEYRNPQRNIRTAFERARQTTPCILVLEDLDSLINDKNRSFFLNELDGFAANTGIVVLATTNHPDRLDPAILNRPSRFDRKYHFELPAAPERAAYVAIWNRDLEPALRLDPAGIEAIVAATEGYSFAYLKELFLSSMMRWIARPGAESMEAIMREQCAMLREQMTNAAEERPADIVTDDDAD